METVNLSLSLSPTFSYPSLTCNPSSTRNFFVRIQIVFTSHCCSERLEGKLWSQTTKTFLRIANSYWKVLVHSHYCFTVHSLVEKDTKKTHQNVLDRNWKRSLQEKMALNSIFVCVIISTVLSGFIAPIADAGPTQCHACIGSTAASCAASQQTQVCATDVNSLGTTHCGTAVGKYRDRNGQVHEGFIRGCINCADKKAACFAVGGALKAREVWTLLQCEIECCTDNNCNTQSPTLSQAAITVFTGGSGPKECNVCVERDQATCTSNQQSQTCASDPNSLGTTHCGTAVGKVRDKDGNIIEGIIRGCIDCADKKAACFALGGAMKAREEWNLQQCELECCTGNKCNTQTPSLSPGAVPVFQPAGDTKPTASGRGGQQVLLSEILAFAIAFAYILYHFL